MSSIEIKKDFHLSWNGVCRMFDLAEKSRGTLGKRHSATLSHMFEQCDETQQAEIQEQFPNVFKTINKDKD